METSHLTTTYSWLFDGHEEQPMNGWSQLSATATVGGGGLGVGVWYIQEIPGGTLYTTHPPVGQARLGRFGFTVHRKLR